MKGESPTLNSRGYLSRKFEDTFTTHEAFHKYLKNYWILNVAKFLGYCQYFYWLNNVNLGEGNFTPLLSTGVCATAWKISIKTSLNAASSRTFVTIALKLIVKLDLSRIPNLVFHHIPRETGRKSSMSSERLMYVLFTSCVQRDYSRVTESVSSPLS